MNSQQSLDCLYGKGFLSEDRYIASSRIIAGLPQDRSNLYAMLAGLEETGEVNPETQPAFTSPPQIIGNPYLGNTITGTNGVTTGGGLTRSYQWYLDGVEIPGQNSNSLLITSSYPHGSEITFEVTVTNSVGSASSISNSVTVVWQPVIVSTGSITGDDAPGSTLSLTAPTVMYATSVSRVWYKNGVSTGVATATYNNTVYDDVITVRITATNAAGSVSQFTDPFQVEILSPPSYVSGGTISGTTALDSTLTASDPIWSGATSTSRQWYKNDIPTGQTGTTYSTPRLDGDSMSCVFTATNAAGSTDWTSNYIEAVAPALPEWVSGGSISGGTGLSDVLTASDPIWSGATSTSREWYKNGSPTGITTNTYSAPRNHGDSMIARFFGTNAGGATSHDSNAIVAVQAAPTYLYGGDISGDSDLDAPLYIDTDAEFDDAVSVTRVWYKNGVSTGLNVNPYTASRVDGDSMTVVWTATNPGGSTSHTSNAIVAEGGGGGIDPDAETYLLAVEAADGQALEPAVWTAWDKFFKAIKAGNEWRPSNTHFTVVANGARTFDGSLIPVIGTALTNANFVSGDRAGRVGGYRGNTTDKRLIGQTSDGWAQNNYGIFCWQTEPPLGGTNRGYFGDMGTTVGTTNYVYGTVAGRVTARSRSVATVTSLATTNCLGVGLNGINRNNSANYIIDTSVGSSTVTQASDGINTTNLSFFARGNTAYLDPRLSAFYQGESYNKTIWVNALTDLFAELTAAIP